MNVKLILSYVGTAYFGWQKTPFGPSIQEEVEKAFGKIVGEATLPEACSRTDRGVHAAAQIVQSRFSRPIELGRLQYGLNAVLPADIRVLSVEEASDEFHPSLDVKAKEYRYFLCLGPVQDPFNRNFSWHVGWSLDLEAMRRAADILEGTHDFSGFTTQKTKDGRRTLYRVDLLSLPGERLQISLSGDRFLYKMARRLVGTLVAAGKGRLSEEQVSNLLQHPDRKQTGMTAPAHGLILYRPRAVYTGSKLGDL